MTINIKRSNNKHLFRKTYLKKINCKKLFDLGLILHHAHMYAHTVLNAFNMHLICTNILFYIQVIP